MLSALKAVPAPHSGDPPFRGSGLGLGLTLADLRNGGPESLKAAVGLDLSVRWHIVRTTKCDLVAT